MSYARIGYVANKLRLGVTMVQCIVCWLTTPRDSGSISIVDINYTYAGTLAY